MFDFIKAQKVHITYIGIILSIVTAGYILLIPKPTEVVKTVSKTKIIDRNIVKKKSQQIDRIIVKKDVAGNTTTTTEHISNGAETIDKTKQRSQMESKTTTRYLSRYSLSVLYPMPITFHDIPTFDPLNTIVMGGVRLGNLPVFLNIGTDMKFKTGYTGFTWEF